ncbi:MAG: glycosyltransferase [Maritimibacter sp.]|nr:glycosyltransferase [Maritimibacter sp.]
MNTGTARPAVDLSLVVPVYNMAGHITHLAGEIAKLGELAAEVIVVDDGSRDGSVEGLRALAAETEALTLIECAENAGAGVARNIGFPQARGRYTLFFDGDDTLHPEAIRATIAVLDRTGADATINCYEFIRDAGDTGTGMNVIDRELWGKFFDKLGGEAFELAEAPRFLEFTNYPWNKIVRTEWYQSLGLEPLFGRTRVNNDILGHWNILLHARILVLVDETIVTHRVSGARDHLSNQFGRERLELFAALRSVHEILRADPALGARYAPIYWSLARRLVTWAKDKVVDPEVDAAFVREARALVADVSFEELLGTHRADAAGTYRWLMHRI